MLKLILLPSVSVLSKIALSTLVGVLLQIALPLKAQFTTYTFERLDKELPVYLESERTLENREDTLRAFKEKKQEKPARWFVPIRTTLAPKSSTAEDTLQGKRKGKAHFSLAGLPAVVHARTRLKEEWKEAKELRFLLKKKKEDSKVREEVSGTLEEALPQRSLPIQEKVEERKTFEVSTPIEKSDSTLEESSTFLPISKETLNALRNTREKVGEKRFSFPKAGPLLITSNYGYRIHPLTGKKKFHAGIDLKMAFKPVFAVLDAEVIESGWDPKGGGNFIRLRHEDGFETSYLHLSELYYSKGERVKAGFIIGKSGSSGRSSGPHLHFAVKKDAKPFCPIAFFRLNYVFLDV